MDPSFGGHNFPPVIQDIYHPYNTPGSMPTPMVGSRSGGNPGWQYGAMPQAEFMVAANSMDDKKPWGIQSVGDSALIAPAKDGEKQASKRSRMSTRDDQQSDGSSHDAGQAHSNMSGTSVPGSSLPRWELDAVLGQHAASLQSGRRRSIAGSDRGRGEVDIVVGSKDSSESQDDSDDDGEEGDDKPRDRTKQQSNRKAAQLSRRRKKERIGELEQNVIQLSRKNHELKVINDTLRELLEQRSQQQRMNEQRIMALLRTKNQQLKHALHELQAHSNRSGELPQAVIMSAATLLGPDFQFQQLGALPPLAAPPSAPASNAFMGGVPQQYGGGAGMFGMEGLGSMPDGHHGHGAYSHPRPPQNRNMGMNMSPMMMPQMPGGMEMGMPHGSFLRPHASQPGMRHDLDGYGPMGMNRMPSEQQELPGIAPQSAKL